MNCGYGRGYSVREVIETVKRLAASDFEVRLASRRPGDSAALIAGVQRIGKALGSRPRYQSLDRIVADALAWEKLCIEKVLPR